MRQTVRLNDSLAFPSTLGLTHSVDQVCETQHGCWQRTISHFVASEDVGETSNVNGGNLMNSEGGAGGKGGTGGGHCSSASAAALAAAQKANASSRTQTPGPRPDPFAQNVLVNAKGDIVRERQPTFEPGSLLKMAGHGQDSPSKLDNASRTMDLWKTINPGCIKEKINTYYHTTYADHHTGEQPGAGERESQRFNFKRNDFTDYTESRAKTVNMSKKQAAA